MPIVLGADKSGKSLLAGLLNCSPDVESKSLFTDLCRYQGFGLDVLYKMHTQLGSTGKFIWLLRNPLESSCSMHEAGISYKKALSYWADINTVIWYFLYSVPENNKICVRYEELLLKDSAVRSVFDFSGIIFNKQYLRYGDFDQFASQDPTFLKGVRDGEKVNFYNYDNELRDSWDKIKNKKIVIQFGYTRRRLWQRE